MGIIRKAQAEDLSFLGELAEEAFSVYGSDYGVMIPTYAQDMRVITLLCEEAGRPVGFIQVGFLEVPGGQQDLIADILAVAVAPAHQCKGHGTALFERALEILRPMRERGTVGDVQLTVADTNGRATRLFWRLGFRVSDEEHGKYEGGQRAIRMRLGPLNPRPRGARGP